MTHPRTTILASLTAFAVGAAGLAMFSHAQDDAAPPEPTEPAGQTEQQADDGHDHDHADGQDHSHEPAEGAAGQDEQPATAEQLMVEPGEGADEADMSYALGFRLGSDFARQGVELEAEEFAAGFTAAVEGEEPRLSQQELMQALFTFQLEMQARQQEQAERVATESREFLEENREAEGVEVTESGLQYKVIEEGEGESPEAGDTVTVHYRGTLVNGQQFDSSYDRGEPAEFRADQVIPGWTEALQMMKPGAKWELYLPAELGYGERGAGESIPPNAALIFEVELLDVESNDDE